MNKKLFIQVILFLLIVIFFVSFYLIYFKKKSEITYEKKGIEKKVENIIQELSYFSKDISGNEYLVEAESGQSNTENSDIIYLNKVNARIKFDKNQIIIVTSDKAIYNNTLFDTEFIGNVVISYDDHKITCENMKATLSKDTAILSGNIVYRSQFSNLYADFIEIDLKKRTSKISMFDLNKKVKVKHLKNGIN